MKEFRLRAWPDLPPAYHRIAYRRMLSDLSQRHLSVQQLVNSSGLTRLEVRAFLNLLGERGLLSERDMPRIGRGAFGRWLRRTLHLEPAEA